MTAYRSPLLTANGGAQAAPRQSAETLLRQAMLPAGWQAHLLADHVEFSGPFDEAVHKVLRRHGVWAQATRAWRVPVGSLGKVVSLLNDRMARRPGDQAAPIAIVHLRVPTEMKGRWIAASRKAGMRLADWIVARVEGTPVTPAQDQGGTESPAP